MTSSVEKNPMVTVLLAIHNGAKTLDRCLESITAQTYPFIRILCIDDASTDETAAILATWQKRLSERLTVLHNKDNLGLTLSLNKGLDAITSPLVARIDADDWWEATKIEKQVRFLVEHPGYGVVGTNYINHAPYQDISVTLPETNTAIQKTLFWHNPFAHSCVVYWKDVILQVGKYDPTIRYAQDYELWVRCSRNTKFHNLQEFLCHRTLGVGISVDKQNDQMRQYLKVLRHYLPLYRRPLTEYAAMVEPLLVLALPEWLKKIKRQYLP